MWNSRFSKALVHTSETRKFRKQSICEFSTRCLQSYVYKPRPSSSVPCWLSSFADESSATVLRPLEHCSRCIGTRRTKMSYIIPKITTFSSQKAASDCTSKMTPWSGVSQFAHRKKYPNTRKGFFWTFTYRATDSAALRRSNILAYGASRHSPSLSMRICDV